MHVLKFWPAAKVLQNKESSPGLHQLLLDVGHLAAGYTKPGQFIQVGLFVAGRMLRDGKKLQWSNGTGTQRSHSARKCMARDHGPLNGAAAGQ